MTLFPIQTPSLGLSLRAHSITAVELGRDWRTGWRINRVQRVAERPLPPGLLRPSTTELNVTDAAKLADEIAMLLDRSGPLPVALTLPDLSARTVLFEFDTLPPKAAECEALIRWRFQKDLNVSAETARLAYLVFRLDPAKPAGAARVLATAIRRSIIEQYEEVCEKAQIIPVRVGLAGLAMFDLCRPVMEKPVSPATADDSEVGELFFMSISDESFSFLAVRDGQPTFLRTKSRNGGAVVPTGAPVGASPATDPSAASLIPKASLADEIRATLQFYDEAGGNLHHHARPGRPLYVAGHDGPPILDPAEAQLLAVKVMTIRPDWFPVFQSRQHETAPATSLAALAGLCAA
jgi:hypothetical protein